MKKLAVILVFLGTCFWSFAQDPELEGEWKLAYIKIDNEIFPSPLPDPAEYVNPKLHYYIQGTNDEEILTSIIDCGDILSADVIVDPISSEITVLLPGWINLLGDCGSNYWNFQSDYYTLIGELTQPPVFLHYEILNQTGGVKTLIITNQDGNSAKYSNVPIPFHLFDEWELEKLVISGVEYPVPVNGEEFNPSFFFTETDDPTLGTFTGDSGCNNFSGMITYDTTNSELTITSRNIGGNTCVEPQNIDFELLYTEFLFDGLPATFGHSTSVDSGLLLELTKSNGDKAYFRRDYNLSTQDVEENSFVLYPNPASDVLNLYSEYYQSITSATIYSLSGKRLISTAENPDVINVASLSEGIYFIEIITERGSVVKKFIKE